MRDVLTLKNGESIPEGFRIWFIQYDDDGNEIGRGVYHKSYVYSGTACNKARELYGDRKHFEYRVCVLNPFEDHYTTGKCEICGEEYDVRVHPSGFTVPSHVTVYRSKSDIFKNDSCVHDFYYECCDSCTNKVKNYIDSLKGETK